MYHFRLETNYSIFNEKRRVDGCGALIVEYFIGESICLLPSEFEGEYIIQNALTNSDVMQYSTINITADSVLPFGQCFFSNDSDIIVVLRYVFRFQVWWYFARKPNIWKLISFPKNLTCLDFLVKIKLQIIFVLRSPDDNPCYRCFNLQMVSKNVILLIHNSDINSKCSSTAEIAALKCPGARILLNDEKKFQNDFHSIILYREYTRPFAFVTF